MIAASPRHPGGVLNGRVGQSESPARSQDIGYTEGRAKTSPSLARLVELSRSRPEDIVGKGPHVLAECTCNPVSKRLTL